MSVRSELICNICRLFLHDPVSLPCFCIVCNEHLHDGTAKDGSIECNSCHKSFQISEHDFRTNKMAKNLLESQLHLTTEEKWLRASIREMFAKLEDSFKSFSSKKVELEMSSFDHFADIRRHIDIQREEIKNKIDEIALKMIDRIREKENEYALRLKEIQLAKSKTDVEKTMQTLGRAMRNPDFTTEHMTQLSSSYQIETSEFVAKFAVLNSLYDKIMECGFVPMKNFKASSFGILNEGDQKLISCSKDKCIQIWDLESNECLNKLEGHAKEVLCLERLDENRFVSGSADKTIKVWDARKSTCLVTLTGHRFGVSCLKTMSENIIASASNKSIKIWNIEKGRCINTLEGHSMRVKCLTCLPNRTLVSGSEDGTIKFWDSDQQLQFWVCIKTFTDVSSIGCLLFLSNGRLASGSANGMISIWNVDSGECEKSLFGHVKSVEKLYALESGELVSCSDAIKIWNVESGTLIKTLYGHDDAIRSLKIRKNGSLLSCSRNGEFKMWNLETSECTKLFVLGDRKQPINDLI